MFFCQSLQCCQGITTDFEGDLSCDSDTNEFQIPTGDKRRQLLEITAVCFHLFEIRRRLAEPGQVVYRSKYIVIPK